MLTTYAEINLTAFADNLRAIRAWIGKGARVMPMIKANAYGHGMLELAPVAIQAGASHLGVARISEGVELRRAGILHPVVVVYYANPAEVILAADYNLTPTLNDPLTAQALSARAVELGKQVKYHVMVDTGMGTFGQLPDETLDFLKYLHTLPNLNLEGVFTHFATADSHDPQFTKEQFSRFIKILDELVAAGIQIPLRHAANSAGIFYHPETHLDLVRPGISIYGLSPADDIPIPVDLTPVLSLKSRIARIRTCPAGTSFGYGRTYVARQPVKVALVPVGYGDGYHRILSNRGAVLIGGQRAPIIGRVSMDQITVDVTHIDGIQEHEEVVLIGRQGAEHITAEEVAGWAGTINYEVVTSLLARVPRVYV
jgi:alanine racemase